MIQLHNITKSFGTLQVLKGIDLTISKGEIVSIVGPSGAGKTTLLQIMGTLDTPDTGSVIIDGTDVTQLNDKELARFRNRQLGFVFQFHQLLPEFTALENISLPALIAGHSKKQATCAPKSCSTTSGSPTAPTTSLPNCLAEKDSEWLLPERSSITPPSSSPTSLLARSTRKTRKNCTSFSFSYAPSSGRPSSSLLTTNHFHKLQTEPYTSKTDK